VPITPTSPAAAPSTSSADSVLLRTEGRAAYLTLNRPRAINALTHEMVLKTSTALVSWQSDDEIEVVIITGAGERGLCAGGDIRAVREAVITGHPRDAAAFWRDEYRLNLAIARYPKPYVAIMDGIVMGGGVGISAHGSVRIVTERSGVAMPETGIGFIPDVGGTYLLSRAPGELGTHLALTGTAIPAPDAILCGLADHFIPSAALPDFTAALSTEDVTTALKSFTTPIPIPTSPPAPTLADHRTWIDDCYAADTVEEIVTRLQHHPNPAANEAAATILTKSPTALKVTLTALRRARALPSLPEVLEQEFLTSCSALTNPDFTEGVRAQVVDKDRDPHWHPATLQEVTPATVTRHFTPPSPADTHHPYLGPLFS
jgi:enoyl-CoA hydratase